MTHTPEQIIELKQIITNLIAMLYDKERPYYEMIQREGMEQAISFQIGLYLYEQMKTIDWMDGLSIDMEYNKNGLNPKRTPRRPNGVRPDIIIHHRGDNTLNAFVVEIKGWWNDEHRENDHIKLEDFTHQEGEYKYGLGVFLDLGKEACFPEYFQNY